MSCGERMVRRQTMECSIYFGYTLFRRSVETGGTARPNTEGRRFRRTVPFRGLWPRKRERQGNLSVYGQDKIRNHSLRDPKSGKKEIANLWKRICLAPHTIPYLFRSDQNMKVMLPDGSVRTIGISLNFPNDVYYPRLELE